MIQLELSALLDRMDSITYASIEDIGLGLYLSLKHDSAKPINGQHISGDVSVSLGQRRRGVRVMLWGETTDY